MRIVEKSPWDFGVSQSHEGHAKAQCCAPVMSGLVYSLPKSPKRSYIHQHVDILSYEKCQPTSTFFATKIKYNPHVLPCSLSLRCQLPLSAAGGQLLQPRDVAGGLPPFHCSDIQSPKATPATVVQSDFIRSSISSGHMDYMLFSLYIIIYGYRYRYYRYYRYYISNRIVRMTCCEITCRFSALHEVYRSPTMSHCQHDELLLQPFLRQNWRISFEGNTCHL